MRFNHNSVLSKLSSPSHLRISWLTWCYYRTHRLPCRRPLSEEYGRNHSLPLIATPEALSLTDRQILQGIVYSRSSHNSGPDSLFLRGLFVMCHSVNTMTLLLPPEAHNSRACKKN